MPHRRAIATFAGILSLTVSVAALAQTPALPQVPGVITGEPQAPAASQEGQAPEQRRPYISKVPSRDDPPPPAAAEGQPGGCQYREHKLELIV